MKRKTLFSLRYSTFEHWNFNLLLVSVADVIVKSNRNFYVDIEQIKILELKLAIGLYVLLVI